MSDSVERPEVGEGACHDEIGDRDDDGALCCRVVEVAQDPELVSVRHDSPSRGDGVQKGLEFLMW